MPRYSRNFIKSPYFHVMTQGINKSYIFNRKEDIKFYIKIMYKLIKDYDLKIIAYCIMNNHTHILIKVQNIEELSKYMQRLNGIYAKYYNKKYERIGYVFRDRYHSEGIFDEKHLYNCISYIYHNPVKAGICKRPQDYPYSNYKKYPDVREVSYNFIDVEEDKEIIYKFVIDKFLHDNKINIKELKYRKDLLKEIIKILNTEYRMSFRKISEKIGISRDTIRNAVRE